MRKTLVEESWAIAFANILLLTKKVLALFIAYYTERNEYFT